MPEEKPYRLHIGCHHGTLVSRDSTNEYYDTRGEAIDAVQKSEEFYASIGYFLWFATIYGSEGKVVWHKNGEPYER